MLNVVSVSLVIVWYNYQRYYEIWPEGEYT